MSDNKLILSILIATTLEREQMFIELMKKFNQQIEDHNLQDEVEICYIQDNKEMDIGSKRNGLLAMARGEYIVFFDDDDEPIDYYVPLIVQKLKQYKPDCIGFKIKMTTDGKNVQMCDHSLKYAKEGWRGPFTGDVKKRYGVDYIRNVTHFNPIKLSIAKRVGFPQVRFSEDKPYSDKVTQICKNEIYLEIPYLFEYRYTTHVPYHKKYGIKK